MTNHDTFASTNSVYSATYQYRTTCTLGTIYTQVFCLLYCLYLGGSTIRGFFFALPILTESLTSKKKLGLLARTPIIDDDILVYTEASLGIRPGVSGKLSGVNAAVWPCRSWLRWPSSGVLCYLVHLFRLSAISTVALDVLFKIAHVSGI